MPFGSYHRYPGTRRVSRLTGALLALLVLLTGSPAALAMPYTLMDGDTLAPETAALLIRGGYPDSGLYFLFSPARFVNLGFGIDVTYTPAFTTAVPIKVQLLESPDESLNLALVVSPAAEFAFATSEAEVRLLLDPGLAGGVRFHRLAGWFVDLRYVLAVPVSKDAAFSHFPRIESGFEINTASVVSLIVSGQVRFVDYEPRRFGYGGHLGLGISLW